MARSGRAMLSSVDVRWIMVVALGSSACGDSNGSPPDAGVELDGAIADAMATVLDADVDGGSVNASALDAGADGRTENTACSTDGGAACACESGLEADGAGGCRKPSACAVHDCQHGSCVAAGDSFSCACAAGYEGARCEVDIDECAAANVCASTLYPCVQTEAPGYACRGQLADWPMPDPSDNAKHPPSYDVSGPGLVIDNVTKLQWQRALPVSYTGCTGQRAVAGDSCTWSEAQAYCAALSIAGLDDFRLPTLIELESITNERKAVAIDALAFPDTPADTFWTGSAFVSGGGPWLVSFADGAASFNGAELNRVRCVRSPRPSAGTPTTRYVANADGSISDARSGLAWRLALGRGSYEDSRTYCAGLGNGFRLPTLKELQTIVDVTHSGPCIDPIFVGTQVGLYWTTSGSPFDEGLWAISFAGGSMVKTDKTAASIWARCVR